MQAPVVGRVELFNEGPAVGPEFCYTVAAGPTVGPMLCTVAACSTVVLARGPDTRFHCLVHQGSAVVGPWSLFAASVCSTRALQWGLGSYVLLVLVPGRPFGGSC